ncbi:hypothetical protein [Fluviicola sp.]|uniref:hypothetical protein n=1 Tax=Fluviicola sp. TaxID=1917219 RepID=UPI0031D7B1EC
MNSEEEKKIIEIALSKNGSLAQLALGAIALKPWRENRDPIQLSEALNKTTPTKNAPKK